MLTIATVLKSGGEYTPKHVRELREGISKHLSTPHRFVCFSDLPGKGYEVIKLKHDWPRWWPKREVGIKSLTRES